MGPLGSNPRHIFHYLQGAKIRSRLAALVGLAAAVGASHASATKPDVQVSTTTLFYSDARTPTIQGGAEQVQQTTDEAPFHRRQESDD